MCLTGRKVQSLRRDGVADFVSQRIKIGLCPTSDCLLIGTLGLTSVKANLSRVTSGCSTNISPCRTNSFDSLRAADYQPVRGSTTLIASIRIAKPRLVGTDEKCRELIANSAEGETGQWTWHHLLRRVICEMSTLRAQPHFWWFGARVNNGNSAVAQSIQNELRIEGPEDKLLAVP